MPKDIDGASEPQGFFAHWSFSWMNKVVGKARKGSLETSDLYFPDENMTHAVHDPFNNAWNWQLQKEKSGYKNASLLTALWKCYGRAYVRAGLCKLMWSLFVITGAFYFVRSLLLFVDPKEKGHPYEDEWTGWCLTAFFFLDAYLLGLALQRMGWGCMNTGVKVRAAITDAVCSKAFMMESVTKETISDVVSFVASDINKIYDGMQEFHYLWTAPLEAFTILALLSSLTKQFALPGVGVMCIVLPLQYYFGYLIARNKYQNYKNTQARGVIVQEVLPSMKLVKYYVWEKFFEDKIMKIRAEEQKLAFRTAIIKTINVAMVFGVPPTTAYVIFTAYEFGNKRLVSAVAFTTLSLFNILRFPLVVLPKALRAASEGLTSLRRVEAFLKNEVNNEVKEVGQPGIQIRDATFHYDNDKTSFKLKVPEFEAKPGEVVAVVGRVGAGKSSLIQALLGNMHLDRGTCYAGGRTGYVPQVAWVQNLTLKDNILFGDQFDHNKYQQVVHACALETDLQILPLGDQTFGGLRGVNLSGGQRQRLNLARAAYFDGDTMLLDNALSAVDHHTAEHIFEHLIKGMFRDKVVVLVTHQLQFLNRCDKVAIMDEGKMLYFGPWNSAAHSVLSKFLPVSEHFDKPEKKPEHKETKRSRRNAPPPTTNTVKLPDTKCTMSQGAGIYMREGGVILGMFVLLFFLAAQISRQMSDYWIRQWVADTVKLYKDDKDNGGRASLIYTKVYLGLVCAFIMFMLFRGSTFFWWTIGSSNRMFKSMLTRVLNTPMGFFLVKPVGDLLINFSSDQDQLDENLPDALHYAGIYGFILLATAVTVSIAINLFSVFAGALVVVTAVMLSLYMPASNVLKRVRSDTAGQLVGLVAETLEGLPVIQAFRHQAYFVAEAARRADSFHRCVFSVESLNLWLAFHCDFFGAILVLGVCCFAVSMKEELGSAVVGLAFSNTIQMLVFYTWTLRLVTEAISLMSAVEKISWLHKFTPIDGKDDVNNDGTSLVTKVKNTKELAKVVVANDRSWPVNGEITFENVSMKYRPGAPLALNNVSFHIPAGEKVGVVGRTGSGKSTTLLALYRMFDLAGGRIIIDGIDTSTLPLNRLRRGLSIVPQEPVMFSGTVRENMDPYNQHSDHELWDILKEVGLDGQAHQAGGLQGMVDGSGSGQWSLGQMQLMCLARAALTHVPILCCDEATAAMDPHTEKIILEIIDRLFEENTIITIAHRLDAVIKSDQVLVMEKGNKQEMAAPTNLLANPESFFSLLVDRSGAAEAAALRKAAAEYAAAKEQRGGRARGW